MCAQVHKCTHTKTYTNTCTNARTQRHIRTRPSLLTINGLQHVAHRDGPTFRSRPSCVCARVRACVCVCAFVCVCKCASVRVYARAGVMKSTVIEPQHPPPQRLAPPFPSCHLSHTFPFREREWRILVNMRGGKLLLPQKAPPRVKIKRRGGGGVGDEGEGRQGKTAAGRGRQAAASSKLFRCLGTRARVGATWV